MPVLTDQQRKMYEDVREMSRGEIDELKEQVEEELSRVKDRIAELQNAMNASKQMYAAACARLGEPNDLEDEESSEES